MQADPQTRPPKSGRSSLVPIAIVVVIAVVAVLAWVFWPKGEAPKPAQDNLPPPVVEQQPQPAAEPEPAPVDNSAAEPEPQQVEAEPATPAPEPVKLPALKDSDPMVRDDLNALMPSQSVVKTQEPQLIDKVTQILATAVEGYLPERQRLIASPDKAFEVVRDGDTIYLDSDSYHRFDPYVAIFVGLDDTKLLAFLDKYQPLFSEAYSQLGLDGDNLKPNLVQIINLALATPDPAEPIKLSQPKVLYQFADPALENLKPIQKILIRMGPDNRAKVKAKLEALKSALDAQ